MNKLKSIYASAYSAAISITVSVAATIGTELSKPLKDLFKNLTGHHWVTKSWLSIILFALFFLIFRAAKKNPGESEAKKALLVLEITAIAGFLVILGFYWYEYLSH